MFQEDQKNESTALVGLSPSDGWNENSADSENVNSVVSDTNKVISRQKKGNAPDTVDSPK